MSGGEAPCYRSRVATRVTLYVEAGCADCAVTRAEIVARGLPFTEVDVTEHPEAVPELLKLTGGRRILPVIVEGTRITVGRRPA